MATQYDHFRQLIDKLESLSPQRISEVEDFVDFLRLRDEHKQMIHAAKHIAEPSFSSVWDNPDDAVYDTL